MRTAGSVALALLLIAALPTPPGAAEPAPLPPHAPIRASGAGALPDLAASEGWPGSGTPVDPYILEGVEIDGSSRHAIWLEGTTQHLVIRNSRLVGPTYTSLPGGSSCGHNALTLRGAQNVRFENNEVIGFMCAVDNYPYYPPSGANIQVLDNTLRGFRDAAVELAKVSGVRVAGNLMESANAKDCVRILGSPGAVVEGNTIRVAATYNVVQLSWLDQGSDGAVVRSNTLDGGGTAGTGLDVTHSARVLIEGNTIASLHPWGTGIDVLYQPGGTIRGNTVDGGFLGVTTRSGSVYAADTDVLGNVVRGATRGLDLSGAGGAVIEGNTVTRFSETGLSVTGSAASVSDNAIDGRDAGRAAGAALVVSTAPGVIVGGNQVHGAQAGLSVWQSPGAIVAGNDVADHDQWGISVGYSPEAQVVDNAVTDVGEEGIEVRSSNRPTIDSNTIRRTGGPGISSWDASQSTVAGNVVEDAAGHGMEIDWAWVVRDNRVERSGGAGLLADRAHSGTIAGNVLKDNGSGIALTDSWAPSLTGNLVTGSRGIGLEIGSGVREGTIAHNTLTGSGGFGIQVVGAWSNVIYDNVFANDRNAREYRLAQCLDPAPCLYLPAGPSDEDLPVNQWFIEPRPGANILGGSMLGGNFWSDYAGSDLNADGLGELPYANTAPPIGLADPMDGITRQPLIDRHPLIGQLASAPGVL